jgi:hypothetical protein
MTPFTGTIAVLLGFICLHLAFINLSLQRDKKRYQSFGEIR